MKISCILPHVHFSINLKLLKSFLILFLLSGLTLESFAQQYQRVYADAEQHSSTQKLLLVTLSQVINPPNAVDNSPFTCDTLTTSVGALSLIQAWQNLQFTGSDKPTPSTPVTVKLGFASSVLNLLGGITIQATRNGTPVGKAYSGGQLAALLNGSTQDEFTFVPGVAYDGVRIAVSPTLGVGVSANIFDAYFLKQVTSPVCSAKPIDDLVGVGEYVSGVNLANFAEDVTNPGHAFDGNESTYATLYASVGIAAYTQETVIFSSPSEKGDSVHVVMANPGGLLNLGVTGQSIEILTYNGNTPVDSIGGASPLLTLRLLEGAGNRFAVSFASKGVFDRVQVRFGGVANVLPSLNLYEIEMIPGAPVININGLPLDTADICDDSSVTLNVADPEANTTYTWWDDSTGGNQLATGASYKVPSGQSIGAHKYYVQALRMSCTVESARAEAVVNILQAQPPVISQPAKDTTICLGQSIVLKALSNQPGATIDWYTQDTGGSPIRSGQDTIHVAPIDTTTYYAATALGSCISVTRTPVTVNVVAAPAAPKVLPDTAYVSLGQSAGFRIVNPIKTFVYNWYTSSAGGTPVHKDTTYTTGPVQGDSVYYVEAASPGGCESPRVKVVVIALPVVNNMPCNYADSQVSPVYTGGSLLNINVLNGVINPQYAVDGDTSTASNIRMNVGVGLGKEFVGQLVKFQHQGRSGDSIRLILGSNTGLLDAGLFGNVQIQFYQGNKPVGTSMALNDALLHLKLLQGSTKSYVTIVAPVDYNGVLVSLGGVLTALTSLDFYNAAQIIPLPTVVGPDTVDICAGDSVTLSVTPAAGTSVVAWYSTPTGGVQLATGNRFTTPTLTDTTTYYAEAIRDGCANPERLPVTVAVASPPVAPSLVADSVIICQGEKASLQVKDPQAGMKYIWYDAANGGNILDTGNTYTTSALNTTSNYYVVALTGGGCTGIARTMATVLVNTAPDAPDLVSDTVYATSGNSVTFNIAGADTINDDYQWYTGATGGTPVATGASFTTPALNASTVYYVETLTKGGCAAVNRTKAVALISTPANPLCNYANSQVGPVYSGICLLCSVTDPNNAIDGDTASASSIRATVGALGYVGQLVYFRHQGSAGDSLRLIMGLPTGLADVQLLGHVRLEIYNGTTPGGNPLFLNNGLIRLTLLSGNKFEVTLPVVSGPYNGILVSIGGALTAVTTLNLYAAEQIIPEPVVNAPSIGICAGDSATLQVTGPNGVDINWYNVASGGALLASGTTFTTPSLTKTTIYYVEASRNSCPDPKRVSDTVKVAVQPAPPAVETPDLSICAGDSAIMKVKDPADTLTYRWYDAATGGNLLATDSVMTTPALNNNKTYYVEAVSAGGCISASRTSVTVKVNAIPVAPVVNPSSASVPSGGTVTFDIQNPVKGYTYQWYAVATGGTVLATGSSFTTPPLYSNAEYYVDAVNATGCASSARTEVTVTVTGFSFTPCSFADAQQTFGNALVAVANIDSAAKAVDDSTTTASHIHILAAVLGGYGQQLIFPFQGHAGDSIHIQLGGEGNTVLQLALLNNIYVATYNGTTPNNDAINVNTPSLITLKLLSAGSNTGIISFKATKDFTSVVIYTSSLLNVALGGGLDIYYASAVVPQPGIVADSVAICSGDSATLEVNNPLSYVTYEWYDAPAGGNLLATGSAYTAKPASDAVYYIQAVRTQDNCANPFRTAARVYVNSGPDNPVPAASQVSVCYNSKADLHIQNNQTNVVYQWYSVPSGGSPLANNDQSGVSFTTPDLTTNITYYVQALDTISHCLNIGGRIPITVKVTPLPAPPQLNVVKDTVCAGGSITLRVMNIQAAMKYVWFTSLHGGSAVDTGDTYTTPPLNSTITYYVEALTGGGCAGGTRTAAMIKVNPRPASPTVQATNVAVCYNTSATLNVSNPPLGISYRWFLSAKGGAVLGTGPSFTTGPMTSGGVFYVEAFDSATGCTSAVRTAVTITVNPLPKVNLLSPDVTICAGEKATLQLQSQKGVTYTWYALSKAAPVQAGTGITLTTPALASGIYTYIAEAATSSGCISAVSDTAVVTVNRRAVTGDIEASSETICAGEQASLTASSKTISHPIFTWYSDAQLKNKIITSSTITIRPAVTTSYYVTVQGTGVCENAPGHADTVTITVNQPAKTGDVSASGVTTICAGDSTTLTAGSKTVNNPVFTWYSDARLSHKIITGTTLTVHPEATATYYVSVQGTGVCESTITSAAAVTVTVNTAPQKPVLKSDGVTICGSGSASLEVASPVNGITYNWYSTAIGGTPVASGSIYTTPVLKQTTTYYVEAKNSSGCINEGGRTLAVVTVTMPPAPPSVKAKDVIVCTGNAATFDIDNANSAYTYNWYATATGGTPLATGLSFTSPALQTNTPYYVQAVTSGGCMDTIRRKVNAEVEGPPTAPTVTALPAPICPGATATLTASSSTPNSTVKWYDAANGGNLVGTGNSFTTPSLNATTIYYVEAVNAGGCSNIGGRIADTVTILKPLLAPDVKMDSATSTDIYFSWTPVAGATGYQVSTDDGTTWNSPSSGATGTTTVVSNLHPMQTVMLWVRPLSQNACQNGGIGKASGAAVNALGDYFFVPNAFTPNGDGLNDVWLIYGNTISKLHVMVYNQYGQKVFESDNQNIGWDGTFKGRKQPVGVYVYYLKVTFLDGKSATKNGDINLIR